jgi:beta-galactosidase
VDEKSGTLLNFAEDSVLQQGPLLNIWRGATDNDGIKLLPGRDHKALNRWLDLGLNNLQHRLENIRIIEDEGPSPIVEIIHQASGRDRWDDFQHIHRYRYLDSNLLLVENTVKVGADMRDLPRIGVSMILKPGRENLWWFGRGPWDNYSDRKVSAMVGLYQSTVTHQYVPYIMPQEHGNKTDTRWLLLTDFEGRGLKVYGQPYLEFSASHFTANDLFEARHTIDLKRRAEIILNLDFAQRGLGTASCGPDTLERYQLNQSEYHFSYQLQIV